MMMQCMMMTSDLIARTSKAMHKEDIMRVTLVKERITNSHEVATIMQWKRTEEGLVTSDQRQYNVKRMNKNKPL